MGTGAIAIVVLDIDGVVRDVGNSYRRALADTVEHFTGGAFRPSQPDIDALKAEGLWNNDWEASYEMTCRYFEQQGQGRSQLNLDYDTMVGFFQRRYRGPNPEDPESWTGYICQEPLLMSAAYLQSLTRANIPWGFFSGATRGSATYVLERRLGVRSALPDGSSGPVLVAMEDAPGKPDPTGLFSVVEQLEARFEVGNCPVLYVGDTVADMQTAAKAARLRSQRQWFGIGVLPPHAQQPPDYAAAYRQKLLAAGAVQVWENVEQLTPNQIGQLVSF